LPDWKDGGVDAVAVRRSGEGARRVAEELDDRSRAAAERGAEVGGIEDVD
jgi:hypothetical protein